jgi:hypothetical protein
MTKLVNQRKLLWKQNGIRTNRPNLPLPDSKAANRAIATKIKSARNRAAATNKAADGNKAEANREAVSKADDKFCAVN